MLVNALFVLAYCSIIVQIRWMLNNAEFLWICKSLAISLTERLRKTKVISLSHVSTERREWKNKVPQVSPRDFLQSLQRYLCLPPLRPFLTTVAEPHSGQTILSSATLDCLHFSNSSMDLLLNFIVADSLPTRASLCFWKTK